VIGKNEDIEALKKEPQLGVPVAVNIEEVRKPEIDAKLIADSITQQRKNIMFRRAMKRATKRHASGLPLGIRSIVGPLGAWH
jgi:small subunit ribosomal protein S3